MGLVSGTVLFVCVCVCVCVCVEGGGVRLEWVQRVRFKG